MNLAWKCAKSTLLLLKKTSILRLERLDFSAVGSVPGGIFEHDLWGYTMLPDFSPIFMRYDALVAEADALFAKVRADHPQQVTCVEGCSDCCHALFDLSLVEAMRLNTAFDADMPHGRARSDLLSRAADIDRQTSRIKRDIYRATKAGTPPQDILHKAAQLRIACPLLGADSLCVLYARRPITCRLYGVPLNIGGKGHVCGKTGFAAGGAFPSVHLDKIQARLEGLSLDIAAAAGSRFKELHQVYVPVSMALLTKYDAQYLGIGPAPLRQTCS